MDLPMIDNIDWDYGRMHFADMDDLLWETTEQYYMMLPESMDKIRSFFAAVDTPDGMNSYRIETHSVKSTSALIGALQLFGLAKTAEFAAKDQDVAKIKAITPILLEEMQKMYENLASHFAKAAGELRDLDVTEALNLCKVIRSAMSSMDVDTVDENVAKLAEFRFEQNMTGLVAQLQSATMNLDGAKTNEILDAMENQLRM